MLKETFRKERMVEVCPTKKASKLSKGFIFKKISQTWRNFDFFCPIWEFFWSWRSMRRLYNKRKYWFIGRRWQRVEKIYFQKKISKIKTFFCPKFENFSILKIDDTSVGQKKHLGGGSKLVHWKRLAECWKDLFSKRF